jgi:hypothetical protein
LEENMEIEYPDRPKWVKLEIGDEEKIACSMCGEFVSDQHVTLKLDLTKKLVVFVECEECVDKWKKIMQMENHADTLREERGE